jgi:iron(III) transport system substrate-binding protein
MKNLTLALAIIILASCSQDNTQDSLTIFTSRQPQLIEPILERYTKKTGIEVTLLSGNAQQLMERIDIEGKDSKADIFMTVDAGVLWQASERGILESVKSEILNTNIPSHLRDVDGEWFGLSKRARTIVFSNDQFSKEDFSTYEDLSYPKWTGKLCLRTSKKVYNRSLIASMIDANGFEQTQKVVQGWVNNLATDVFSNDTNALKAVSSGQCGFTIVNTYYLARLLSDSAYDNLELFWANQNDRGVHVNISGAGLVKTSKNKLEAIKLLEYLSSAEAQDEYASANKEFPVLIGAKVDDSIAEWGSFIEDTIGVEKLGKLQKEAVFLAQEASYD